MRLAFAAVQPGDPQSSGSGPNEQPGKANDAEQRLRRRIATVFGVVAFGAAIVLADPFRMWPLDRQGSPVVLGIMLLASAAFLGLASFDAIKRLLG